MKSNRIVKTLIAFTLIAMVTLLSACGGSDIFHRHTYESKWTFDDEAHWHAATCEHTDERADFAAHAWDEGNVTKEPTADETGEIVFTCTVCQYTYKEEIEPHEHTFSEGWTHDEENHWHSATCDHTNLKSGLEQHVWDTGTLVVQPTKEVEGIVKYTCTVCDYEKEENIGLLKDQITVQFIDYDGSIFDVQILDIDQEHGASALRPEDPVRDNHRFVGWDGPLEGLWADTVLHAIYIRQYIVVFFDYDGDVLKECLVDEGGDAEPPQEPTRQGYNFLGWDGTYKSVYSDEQVIAEYGIDVYKVKFYMPDGSLIEEQNVKYGFLPQEPALKEVYIDWKKVKGYRFTAWDKPIAAATSNCEYHAQYLEEVTDPIMAVDAEAHKEIRGGTAEAENIDIRIYLIGDISIYGLSLDISYDSPMSLGDEKSVEIQQNFSSSEQSGVRLDDVKKNYKLNWSSSTSLKVVGNVQILTFRFKFPYRPRIGDYNITIGQNSYIIDEKLEKVKPIIVSDYITVV